MELWEFQVRKRCSVPNNLLYKKVALEGKYVIEFTKATNLIKLEVRTSASTCNTSIINKYTNKPIEEKFFIECMEDKVNIHLPIPGEKGFKITQKKLIKQALYLSLGLSHNSLEEFIKKMGFSRSFFESFKLFKTIVYNRAEDSFTFVLRKNKDYSFKII